MAESRIDRALARIEAALSRIDAAHKSAVAQKTAKDAETGAHSSGRVMELVNTHEKLREEVADTLRDLDSLIGELEG